MVSAAAGLNHSARFLKGSLDVNITYLWQKILQEKSVLNYRKNYRTISNLTWWKEECHAHVFLYLLVTELNRSYVMILVAGASKANQKLMGYTFGAALFRRNNTKKICPQNLKPWRGDFPSKKKTCKYTENWIMIDFWSMLLPTISSHQVLNKEKQESTSSLFC